MLKKIKNILINFRDLFKAEDLFDPFEGHQDIMPIKKSGISFAQAIEEIRNGKRVRRPKWKKDVSIGKRLSRARNTYHTKIAKFVLIQGKDNRPSKWTPWLEDLYANDWEIYDLKECDVGLMGLNSLDIWKSCDFDLDAEYDCLHEVDKGE